MKDMCQISARVPAQSKSQLASLVEAYQAQIEVGRVSQADVIADIIKKTYDQFQQDGKIARK